MVVKTILRVLGAALVVNLALGLVLGGTAVLGLYDRVMGDYAAMRLAAVVLAVVATGLLLLYAQRLGGVPVSAFSFAWERRDGIFVAGTAVGTFGLAWGYMALLDRTGVRPLDWAAPRWGLVAAGLLGACTTLYEEVQARGYVLTVLRRYGVGRALLLSAVVFMLMHIPTRGVGPLMATWLLTGLVWGYLYVKSGSLWAPIAAHAAHNFASDVFLYNDTGASVVHFAGKLGGLEKVGFEVLLALLTLGLIYLVYTRGTRPLAPAARLERRWTSLAEDEPGPQAQPVPA